MYSHYTAPAQKRRTLHVSTLKNPYKNEDPGKLTSIPGMSKYLSAQRTIRAQKAYNMRHGTCTSSHTLGSLADCGISCGAADYVVVLCRDHDLRYADAFKLTDIESRSCLRGDFEDWKARKSAEKRYANDIVDDSGSVVDTSKRTPISHRVKRIASAEERQGLQDAKEDEQAVTREGLNFHYAALTRSPRHNS